MFEIGDQVLVTRGNTWAGKTCIVIAIINGVIRVRPLGVHPAANMWWDFSPEDLWKEN